MGSRKQARWASAPFTFLWCRCGVSHRSPAYKAVLRHCSSWPWKWEVGQAGWAVGIISCLVSVNVEASVWGIQLGALLCSLGAPPLQSELFLLATIPSLPWTLPARRSFFSPSFLTLDFMILSFPSLPPSTPLFLSSFLSWEPNLGSFAF